MGQHSHYKNPCNAKKFASKQPVCRLKLLYQYASIMKLSFCLNAISQLQHMLWQFLLKVVNWDFNKCSVHLSTSTNASSHPDHVSIIAKENHTVFYQSWNASYLWHASGKRIRHDLMNNHQLLRASSLTGKKINKSMTQCRQSRCRHCGVKRYAFIYSQQWQNELERSAPWSVMPSHNRSNGWLSWSDQLPSSSRLLARGFIKVPGTDLYEVVLTQESYWFIIIMLHHGSSSSSFHMQMRNIRETLIRLPIKKCISKVMHQDPTEVVKSLPLSNNFTVM